jgi:hypothetical protein
MKKLFLFSAFIGLNITLFAQKITLTMDNLTNVTGSRADVYTLIDEQAKAGTGTTPSCTTCPSTTFQNGANGAAYINQNLYYPLEVIIDLWGDYNITNFYYFDASGSDSIIISVGTPANWNHIVKSTTSAYNSWHANPINATTRYIHLKIKSVNTLINEIAIYGNPVGTITKPAPPAPVKWSYPAMEDLIGMNSLFDVPDSIAKVVKVIREYHDWQWDEGDVTTTYPGYPNNQNAWQPSWAGGGYWNFDTYYSNALKMGQTVCPAVQKDAPFILNFASVSNQRKPIKVSGANPQDPNSYKEHADHMFQFAARYGSTVVPAAKLKVRSTNTAKSGLGLLKYLEDWNEPDRNWDPDGRPTYFSPFELAAMSSADCDGHQGTMGTTFGMKAADPNIKFVQAGLINIDTLYVKSMVFWNNYFRSGDQSFDVINFHHYSNDAGGQGATATKGISPEADNLKVKVQQAVNFRNKNIPGIEIWFSEFGYDTQPSSIQAAKAIGTQDAWEVQARWIIRSYLAYAAGGADRAHMYIARDVDESSTLFNTSGLTTPNANGTYKAYTKKKSWYYLYTFRKSLTGYRFKQEISSGNANVLIYSFENIKDPSKLMYAVWAPTATDQTVSNYSLALPSNVSSASKIELTNKDTTGAATSLTITNKTTSLTVDEKPDLIYIQTSGAVVTDLDPFAESATAVFNVYPNPFSNSIQVRYPSMEHLTSVVVRDVRGTVVKTFSAEEATQKMELDELGKGVYIVEGTTDKNVYVSKVIKN